MQSFKKERLQLENASSKLISLALQAGAQTAEVCGSFRQSTKITLEKQDYHLASADEGASFGLRVICDDRLGFTSCNTFEPQDLKEIAHRAVEIAKFSPRNPYFTIQGAANNAKEAPHALWDDSLYQVSLQTQKDWVKWMIEEALRDSRFRLNDGQLSLSASVALVSNSLGTHKAERETAASWSLMGMGVEGDNITSFDYFSELSRHAAGIQDRMVASTKKFRDSVLANLKTGAPKSYKGLVAFSPRAVVDILLSSLAYHLSGRSVVEKTGKWTLKDLQAPLLDSRLTIQDNPWLVDRGGCSAFDREGTPTRPLNLFDKGVLQTFLLDNYAAKALNLASTGHAAGGPSALPSVGSHCMILSPGEESWDELRARATKEQKEILLVHRYSGQVDSVTGDFSGVAKGAEWWNGGEHVYNVKETLISGNIFDVLSRELFGLSRETEVIDSNESSPYLVAAGVSVTAG